MQHSVAKNEIAMGPEAIRQGDVAARPSRASDIAFANCFWAHGSLVRARAKSTDIGQMVTPRFNGQSSVLPETSTVSLGSLDAAEGVAPTKGPEG